MGKKYEILTLIKRDHKFGGNEFVLGKIYGIGYCMSGFSKESTLICIDEGHVYKNKFTIDEYDDFMNEVERLYPGLCKFDYKLKQESK